MNVLGPCPFVSSALQRSLVDIWKLFMGLSMYIILTGTLSLLLWHDANTCEMYRPWA